jgi:hypothetical protein
VETGITGATDIEVFSGLKDGDEIVTGSYKVIRTIRNEAKIKVDNNKAPSEVGDVGDIISTYQRKSDEHGQCEPRRSLSAERELKREGVVIRTYDLWKTYVMGDQEIHAVSAWTWRSTSASMSPSWARRGPVSRR